MAIGQKVLLDTARNEVMLGRVRDLAVGAVVVYDKKRKRILQAIAPPEKRPPTIPITGGTDLWKLPWAIRTGFGHASGDDLRHLGSGGPSDVAAPMFLPEMSRIRLAAIKRDRDDEMLSRMPLVHAVSENWPTPPPTPAFLPESGLFRNQVWVENPEASEGDRLVYAIGSGPSAETPTLGTGTVVTSQIVNIAPAIRAFLAKEPGTAWVRAVVERLGRYGKRVETSFVLDESPAFVPATIISPNTGAWQAGGPIWAINTDWRRGDVLECDIVGQRHTFERPMVEMRSLFPNWTFQPPPDSPPGTQWDILGVLRARVVRGGDPGDWTTAVFTLHGTNQIPAPTFTPPGGEAVEVVIDSPWTASGQGKIHYGYEGGAWGTVEGSRIEILVPRTITLMACLEIHGTVGPVAARSFHLPGQG